MTGVTGGPLVSVVMPVLHDSEALAESLARIARQARGGSCEVIVASGAPLDESLRALQAAYPEVRWVVSAPGRGVQMNAGAATARGAWLLFLHADTTLDDGWLDAVGACDASPDRAAGCFRFALDSRAFAARVVEWGVGWRVRVLGMPYGDQALFMRRVVFEALGGYASLPLMEDVELVRRLKARGHRVHPVALSATTSARRWERDGWIRRTGTNMLLVTLYSLKVSPTRLAGWYHWNDGRDGLATGGRTVRGTVVMRK